MGRGASRHGRALGTGTLRVTLGGPHCGPAFARLLAVAETVPTACVVPQ